MSPCSSSAGIQISTSPETTNWFVEMLFTCRNPDKDVDVVCRKSAMRPVINASLCWNIQEDVHTEQTILSSVSTTERCYNS